MPSEQILYLYCMISVIFILLIVFYVFVGPPMCTFTPMVSDLSTNTTCGFSVSWTTPSCSSGWLTTDVQMAYNVFVRPVGGSSGSSEGTVNRMSTSQFEVTDLFPNTSYNIMMILKNRCGEGSSVTVSGTTS